MLTPCRGKQSNTEQHDPSFSFVPTSCALAWTGEGTAPATGSIDDRTTGCTALQSRRVLPGNSYCEIKRDCGCNAGTDIDPAQAPGILRMFGSVNFAAGLDRCPFRTDP